MITNSIINKKGDCNPAMKNINPMLRLLSVVLEPNEIHYICFILLQLLSKLPLCLLVLLSLLIV